MLIKGKWEPTAKPRKQNYRSYWISSLYSPVGMLSWTELYQKYLEEGEFFIPKYKALLEAGGSQFPVDLAGSVGLDITQEYLIIFPIGA